MYAWKACDVQEEGTGYEVPRKSSKLEEQSQMWDSAADCLAQMSLQAKACQGNFGGASMVNVVQQV